MADTAEARVAAVMRGPWRRFVKGPRLSRRALAVLMLLAMLPAAAVAGDWDRQRLFDHVIERAASRAAEPWQDPAAQRPVRAPMLDYDAYRALRFRPEAALWRGETRFEVQFFATGGRHRTPVRIHELADGSVRDIAFDPDWFRYDGEPLDEAPAPLAAGGFAGLRLHYPLNRRGYKDELAVFLGASYFRVVGPDQVYGLSARGLAVNTTGGEAEEFPAFRRFWLVRPAADADQMTLFALLEGASVTAAYRFDFRVAAGRTEVKVDQHLFARTALDRVGIAPLTSMFLQGDTSAAESDDFRRHIHDSDGLQMHTSSGEWLWRPLANRRAVRVTSLRDRKPEGFGLAQRARDFERYLDLEAAYHRRPSLWIEPLAGDWDRGGVELVEIPTATETADNIVAYWAPQETIPAGGRRHYRYRMTTFARSPPGHERARVVRTREGWGRVPGAQDPPPRSVRRFVVDYAAPPALADLDPDSLEANVAVSAGEISELRVERLPSAGDWRVSFLLTPAGAQPADMHLTLRHDGEPVAETWTYVWYPQNAR